MTRIAARTTLSLLLVAVFSISAQAKDPFNQLGDILGPKLIRITPKPHWGKAYSPKKKKPSLTTKVSYQRLEFLAVSGEDLLAVDGYESIRVAVNGYGSGSFMWERDGDIYEIDQYPANNNHKPVSGIVHHANGDWSKFQLIHRKLKPTAISGRWSGELAFPGNPFLGLALNVANNSKGNTGAYTRIDILGFPSQPASIHKNDTGFSTQFLFWNEEAEGVFFITLSGTVTKDGEIFQGQATAWDLYGGGQSKGKFLLFRPQGLTL